MMNNISFSQEKISLPSPEKGKFSLNEVLSLRRSIRDYSLSSLTLEEVSTLLWAGYGRNNWGRKTVPSAGALYPIFLYIVVGEVDGLDEGIYLYDSEEHALIKLSSSNSRSQLSRASLNQRWVKVAPLLIIISADFSITTSRYDNRGIRYVWMEGGYVGQNIYLEATALKLATVAVGAFYDEKVKRILNIKEEPLLIMPVGRPKERKW